MGRHSHDGSVIVAGVAAVLISLLGQPLTAAEVSATTTVPASQPAESTRARKPYTSKAYEVRLETQPPGYVRTLSETGIPGLEEYDWLEFGLEHRTRFELRDDDYRRPVLEDDEQFLLRSRGYVGVKKVLDPLRFGLEFQDSRQFNSQFPETDSDVDEADFLQMFAELYFEDVFGKNEPLRFQAGRFTLDLIDRKLVGRSRWRNTTNTFEGFRVRLGEATSDWELNTFAVRPVERFTVQPDHGDDERWFYGLTGSWRRWDRYVVLEPYYFVLDEDRKDPASADREIHTLGAHAFGPIGTTGFDYDVDTAFQFGEDGERRQCAFAGYGEVGYTFAHAWSPRLSFSTSYGSGDRDPDDDVTERFDRLFAANHSRSMLDYWTWQNVINPKWRIEIRPTKKLRLDAAYGGYWLASDSDAWVQTGRQDPAGQSGDCVGQELEIRAKYQIDPRIAIELGYAHFMPGPFVDNTGPADDSDFFYVTTTFTLFE